MLFYSNNYSLARLFSSATADGTNDFLYKDFFAKGCLYLRPDGKSSNMAFKGCLRSDVQCLAFLLRDLI